MDERHAEDLARRAHARYAQLRGVAATPWPELTETERAANLDSARFAPVILAALGLAIVASPHPRARDALTEEEVEAGGILEHLRWARFTRRAGAPDHPDLVAWTELDEPTRELDRVRVRDLPALLAAQGLAIVDQDAAG